VPANPGPCPDDATLDSKELHLAQAIELCRRIWKDKSKPKADRALAMSWLCHLVADSHQPCHAGSLYTEKLFPNGDRGANSIKTKQRGNLHALWDGLLGPDWDAGDIRRRQKEIAEDPYLNFAAKAAKTDATEWIMETSIIGLNRVYDNEVFGQIERAEKQPDPKLDEIDRSESYLREAGRISKVRAAYASERLAKILAEGL
jgi:hypothetical protein